ncbi:MAG: multifunctional oxoglutarate decarboxylase/oxoglutarate dehydrogenase thiamine pyrophosphate-binding subunit/dihydrolipoyllysine-residue succinyltransferase subunit, partial [Mycobacteriaceae bacterium]
DSSTKDRNVVTKLLFTSGKLYYELAAKQAVDNITDTAIIRIEQLYPIPQRRIAEALSNYPNARTVKWVQEEPANQGAWPLFGLALPELLPEQLSGIKRVSRRPMAAPSAGSSKVHAVEQAELVAEAFT